MHVLKQLNQYLRAARDLTQKLDHEPTAEDIAKFTKDDVNKVKKTLSVTTASESIDQIYDDSKRPIIDTMGSGELHSLAKGFEDGEFLKHFRGLVDRLNDKHKTVVIMRYGLEGDDPATLEQVGNKLKRIKRRSPFYISVARLLWEQDVGSSNPSTPTSFSICAPVAHLDRASAF